MKPWRSYQIEVAKVAGDVFVSLTGLTQPITVTEDVRKAGRNGPHQIDVLVEAGRLSLFVECKQHHRGLTKDAVSTTLYNFLDVCLAHPDRLWSLVIAAPVDVPGRARMPAMRPDRIYAPLPNLTGGSLEKAVHFVYFKPPASPTEAVPFFIAGEERVTVGEIGKHRDIDLLDLWDRLNDPANALSVRVRAGLSLAARDPELLVQNEEAGYTLVHGLMHLGRTQEALYVRKLLGTGRRYRVAATVDELMIRFLLTRCRYPRRARAGTKSIESLRKMIGKVGLLDEVSIRTFVGPVIASWGYEDGLELLDGVRPQVDRLDTASAPYFELLRLARKAQLVVSSSEREELLENAASLTETLPPWNRYIGSSLLKAAKADSRTLHGLEVPFDAEEWGNRDISRAAGIRQSPAR